MIKSYGFGKAKITLDSDEDFEDGKQLKPFLMEDCEDGLLCRFRREDDFLLPEENLCFSSKSYKVYSSNGRILKTYLIPMLKKEAAVVERSASGYSCTIKKVYSEHFSYGINLLNAIGIERIAYEFGMFILHCSCIELNGEAILFSGTSGIGKSTRANLWNKVTGSEIINGDKIGLFIEKGKLFACGLPVAGSSDIYVNKILPVRSIVFLEQSQNNFTRKAELTESLQRIYYNMIINQWDEEFCSKASDFISEIIKCGFIYISKCNTDDTSVSEQMKAIGLRND